MFIICLFVCVQEQFSRYINTDDKKSAVYLQKKNANRGIREGFRAIHVQDAARYVIQNIRSMVNCAPLSSSPSTYIHVLYSLLHCCKLYRQRFGEDPSVVVWSQRQQNQNRHILSAFTKPYLLICLFASHRSWMHTSKNLTHHNDSQWKEPPNIKSLWVVYGTFMANSGSQYSEMSWAMFVDFHAHC